MYSKAKAAQLKEKFWTSFGRYMHPVPNSAGERINWINYKTGKKDVFIRLQADNKLATIALVLQHNDLELRQKLYTLLQSFNESLQQPAAYNWQWFPETFNEYGKSVAKIEAGIAGVNIFNEQSWPVIINFLKPYLIALDAFWNEVKEWMD